MVSFFGGYIFEFELSDPLMIKNKHLIRIKEYFSKTKEIKDAKNT